MLGYLFATFIGLSLGMLGGGGSILTVPILVYVFKLDAKLAIALSLAVVGITSLVGIIGHFKKGNVVLKVAGVFAPGAMLGTFLGAKLSAYMSGQLQLILFGVVMLLASGLMIRGRKEVEEKKIDLGLKEILLIIIQGLFVGVLTGVVGVGGGFMIVPALVLLTGLSMRQAVGTSLVIICLNSLSGFYGYLGQFEMPYPLLLKFSLFSVVGILLGTAIVPYIPQQKLKKGFGYFLILMGVFVLVKNLG